MLFKFDSIIRIYDILSYKIEALKDISTEFRESEFVSILGYPDVERVLC